MKRPRHVASPPDRESERFRALVQTFVRRFGLLVSSQTPCGHPVSVSHAHALTLLLEQQQRETIVSQADLGKALGIDKSNVARLCSKMAKMGHATQMRPARDRRVRQVELTDRGARLAREIEHASLARFERILAHVPARRRSRLFDSLSILNAAVAALRQPQESP